MNRLLNANHRMLVSLRRTVRASQRRRWVASGLSLALVLVPLLGTLTFTPSVQATSSASSPTSPVTPAQSRPPHIVIQDTGYDEAAALEAQEQVISELLAAHQLPASDGERLLDWERDLVRAGLFSKIVGIARKDPATVTPNETLLVNTLTLRVMQRRYQAAVFALNQYQLWERNPCAYSAPAGFPAYSRPCSCYSNLCGLFGGPKPPAFQSLQAYGAAAAHSQFQTSLAAQRVAADTAKDMAILYGFTAVTGAGLGGIAAGFAGLGLAVVYSLHPILLIPGATLVPGSTLAAAAAPSVSVGLGGSIAIIVAAVVTAVFEGIGVVEAAETPGKLQAAVDNAAFARDHISNSIATLKDLVSTPAGYQEVYYEFIAATLPDSPPTTSVPPQNFDDPKFLLQPGNTVTPLLRYRDWEGKQHTARLSGGWFVDKRENEAERLTLGIDYQDHHRHIVLGPADIPSIIGLAWATSRRGLNFVHARSGDAAFKPFTSPEIKYMDWNGELVTASIAVPAHTIEALPVSAVLGRTVRQPLGIINTTDSFRGGFVSINGTVNASGNGVNISNLAIDSSNRVVADVSAICGAGAANFPLTFTEFGGTTATTTLAVQASLVTDNPLPLSLPDSKVSDSSNFGPPYRAPLGASYGCSQFNPVFSVESGQLPPGLSLSPSVESCDSSGNCSVAAEVIGTPTAAGRYLFTLKLSFFGGERHTRTYAVNISGPAVEAPYGMIGWWRGEGDTTDASGSINATGQFNHARPADPAGNQKYETGWVGRGFKFEGSFNDSILLPNTIFPAPPLTFEQDQFSFETWFKTAPGTGFGDLTHVILGQENTEGTSGLPAIYVGNDGNLRAQMFWNGSINPITSTVRVNDGNFHHVAVTHDGGFQQVYLDGELIGTRTGFQQTAYATEYRYRLGAGRTVDWPAASQTIFSPTGYAYFTGVIDETAIYNRALSPVEVKRIFAAGGAGKVLIEASIAAVSCINGNKGSIRVEAQGANLPFTYALNDGPFQAEPFFGDLDGGEYQIKVKDGLSNIYTRTETATVSEQPFSFSPGSVTLSADGGSGQVSVTAGFSCSFSATSNNPDFITATADNGLAKLNYTVAPNPYPAARTGTVTVTNGYDSKVFTIRQDAPPDNDGDGQTNADETACGSDPLNAASRAADNDSDNSPDCVDADDDNDGVADSSDNCPVNANANQANNDSDAQGNVCDADDDNDGQTDADETACGSNPLSAASKATDTDNDTRPDCVDPDDDNDGVLDTADNCPLVVNPNQADFDLDGIGDTCDAQTGPPRNKEQCKNNGWMRFDTPRRFKNYGECIQFVNTGK